MAGDDDDDHSKTKTDVKINVKVKANVKKNVKAKANVKPNVKAKPNVVKSKSKTTPTTTTPPKTPSTTTATTTTSSSSLLEQQYRLLMNHNIPLGTTSTEIKRRNAILERLLALNDQLNIPSETGKVKKKSVIRVPLLTKPELHRLRYANTSSGFMDNFLKCLCPSPDNNDHHDNHNHNNNNVEGGADLLCHYLAKYHTESFRKHIDIAQKQVGYTKKWENRKPFEGAPADLIMYDGGSREKAHHVAWNIRFRDLLAFKDQTGHCKVPQSRSSKVGEELYQLRNWVQTMREYRKNNNKRLTPKRLELLNNVGFAWELEKGGYNAVDDERYIKAVAARLFFEPDGLTSREAMLLTGFSYEEACNDNRKKLVNHRVRNFYKKDFQIKEQVQKLLQTLEEIPYLCDSGGGEEGVSHRTLQALERFFGPSDLLTQLLMEGKLIPRDANHREGRSGGGGEEEEDDDDDENDDESESESEEEEEGSEEDEMEEEEEDEETVHYHGPPGKRPRLDARRGIPDGNLQQQHHHHHHQQQQSNYAHHNHHTHMGWSTVGVGANAPYDPRAAAVPRPMMMTPMTMMTTQTMGGDHQRHHHNHHPHHHRHATRDLPPPGPPPPAQQWS